MKIPRHTMHETRRLWHNAKHIRSPRSNFHKDQNHFLFFCLFFFSFSASHCCAPIFPFATMLCAKTLFPHSFDLVFLLLVVCSLVERLLLGAWRLGAKQKKLKKLSTDEWRRRRRHTNDTRRRKRSEELWTTRVLCASRYLKSFHFPRFKALPWNKFALFFHKNFSPFFICIASRLLSHRTTIPPISHTKSKSEVTLVDDREMYLPR